MFGCGNLCKLLQRALLRDKFRHCVVELPWSFDGLFNQNRWCFRDLCMDQVTWRLRGTSNDATSKLRTANIFFNRHDVRRFILEDVDFGLSVNARELGRLRDEHVNLTGIDFVECAFPPVAQWGLFLGALFPTLCQLYDVSFERCSLDERELRQAFPAIGFTCKCL
jgi:hypothetical protein